MSVATYHVRRAPRAGTDWGRYAVGARASLNTAAQSRRFRPGRYADYPPRPASGNLPTFVTVVFTVLLSFIGVVVFTALPTYVPITVAVLPTFVTVTIAVFTGTNACRPNT
jgi:hypothetical protein